MFVCKSDVDRYFSQLDGAVKGQFSCITSYVYTVFNLKVSHPRCVVKIQVREENPILYSHKTQLNMFSCVL